MRIDGVNPNLGNVRNVPQPKVEGKPEVKEGKGKLAEISERVDEFVREHPVLANAGAAAAGAALGYAVATGKNPVKAAGKFVKSTVLGGLGKIGGAIVGGYAGYQLTTLALTATGVATALTGPIGGLVGLILLGGGTVTGLVIGGKVGETIGRKLGQL